MSFDKHKNPGLMVGIFFALRFMDYIDIANIVRK